MAGARLALVVANEDYADDGLRRLAAPGRDADALAEILGDRSVGGFDVQVLRNESAQQIRFAIEDFFADRSPTDLLLVHFLPWREERVRGVVPSRSGHSPDAARFDRSRRRLRKPSNG
jgi:hypothetical protein